MSKGTWEEFDSAEEQLDWCHRQIMRLGMKDGFPIGNEVAQLEMAKTLYEAGRSRRHAQSVIDQLRDKPGRCPEPPHIRQEAWELLTPEQRQVSYRNCRRCQGTGYETYRKDGIDYARPCNHAPKPASEDIPFCGRCRGEGHYPTTTGRRQRCSCQAGQQLSDEILELVNKPWKGPVKYHIPTPKKVLKRFL